MCSTLNNLNIVIYPGFSKTATTSIQEHFYKNKNFITFCKPDFLNSNKKIINIFEKVRIDDDKDFNYKECKKNIVNIIKKLDNKKTIIISDESLITASFNNQERTAKRLKYIFNDNVKIFFTIRNQLSLLESRYKFFIKKMKSNNKFINFNDWVYENYSKDSKYFEDNLCQIDFANIIQIYEKIFDKSKVKIFTFENFKKDQIKTISEIFEFCSNKKLFLKDLKIDKIHLRQGIRLNEYIFKKIQLNFSTLYSIIRDILPEKIKLYLKKRILNQNKKLLITNKTKEIIKDLTEEGNSNLDNKYNLNLKKDNYFIKKLDS